MWLEGALHVWFAAVHHLIFFMIFDKTVQQYSGTLDRDRGARWRCNPFFLSTILPVSLYDT